MCTSFMITSTSKDIFWGRTMDLNMSMFGEDSGIDFDVHIITVPRGAVMGSQLEDWTAKYGMMGMASKDTSLVYDGTNEFGLTGGCQVLKEATFETKENILKQGKIPAISEEFVGYVLTNFKDVADIRANYDKFSIVDQNFSYKGGLFKFPLHFTFIDKTGDGIVLEPVLNGSFKAHEYIGVTANSPEYDYHSINIRNYIGLENGDVSAKVFNPKVTLDPIESGTGFGLLGMPGDYTSPSRFIRGFYYSNMIDAFDSSEGMNTLYSAFHSLIIPKGLEHSLKNKNVMDYTRYWSGYDLTNQTLAIQTARGLAFTTKKFDPTVDVITYTKVNIGNYFYQGV